MPKLLGSVGRGGGHNHNSGDVRIVQQLVNRFRLLTMGLLRVDGAAGHFTIAAIEDFQFRVMKMARPDGLVLPDGPTFKALCGGNPALDKVAWGTKVSADFRTTTLSISKDLGLPPDFLMSCMAFESGESFSPSVPNAAGSGAVSLIQFMPTTAKGLGTTTDKLAKLTAVQQLDYVAKFFSPRKGKLHSLEDVYMAILYPAAIGESPDETLFNKGTTEYKQNRGLDANNDGKITVAEAAGKVRLKFQKGVSPGFLA